LGVKFYNKGSSYKSALLDIDKNTPLVAAQLAGDFVMPRDTTKKLAFIAGGIGITPFRSMVKYLIDTKQPRVVSLLYAARTEADFAYKDIFETARQVIGLDTLYVVSAPGTVMSSPNTIVGRINADVIQQTIPDYQERIFYVSGTHSMVEAARETLRQLGVNRSNIKTDFFPGYA
jgi:ferredoxin-NADP reductase